MLVNAKYATLLKMESDLILDSLTGIKEGDKGFSTGLLVFLTLQKDFWKF